MIKLDNNYLEFYNNQWILWKNHNKDFTKGSYYALNDDGTIDFIMESCDNVKVIQDIGKTNIK